MMPKIWRFDRKVQSLIAIFVTSVAFAAVRTLTGTDAPQDSSGTARAGMQGQALNRRSGSQPPGHGNSQVIDSRIDNLLQKMTLEEKVGQLVQFSAGTPTGPGTGRADLKEQIVKGQIGSLLNATNTDELQHIAVTQSRLKIPLLFGLDVIHGYHTIFPVPLGMASTWDAQLVEKTARIAAEEASKDGIRWTFSPMVDIARDARWGRIVEGAGEDPYLGSVMAGAYVHGYQGTSLSNPDSIAACAKHYAGYGAAEAGRDYNPADMSELTLREVYLPPFQAAVNAGAASVMSAFNSLNRIPATANSMTLTQILRREWGFRGLVVSDWDAVSELVQQGVATDQATAARKALLAGLDMDMESGAYQQTLAGQVRSGKLPVSALNEAVRRVLRVKFELGLFEHPYAQPATVSQTERAERRVLARQAAAESLILLKNDRSVLPLSAATRTMALIGPFADNASAMLGSWPGRGDPKDAITLKFALTDRLQHTGGTLLYAQGAAIDSADDSGFAGAVDAANRAQIVIAALGEDPATMTAEAASRAHLGLPGNQEQLLEKLVATGKPVVLIVFSGRPLAVTWAAEHVSAIIQAWYPGIEAGSALVSRLFGDGDFNGRLPVSVPRSVGQEPLYYNALNVGRPPAGVALSHPPHNDAEKYVSRYIDEENSPLYPFGYGLSYSPSSYSAVQVSAGSIGLDTVNRGGTVQVSATITNQGDLARNEPVQLYVGERGTSVVRPAKELRDVRLLHLKPRESQTVEFKVGRDQLSYWNLNMQHIVEPMQVTVWIGPNSAAGQKAEFTVLPPPISSKPE